MTDLSTVDLAGVELALGGDDDFGAESSDVRPPDDSGEKDAPKPEKSVEDELSSSYDEIFAGSGKDNDAAWSREQRRLADDLLRAYGISPDERHARGYSRREVTRRLYNADRLLREDPAAGFASMAAAYGDGLAPELRAKIAGGVIQRLGFSTPAAIGETERQRLAAYDQQAAEHRAAEARLQPIVAAQVDAFRRANPDYEELRTTAAAFVSTGAASTIERAFELARAATGRPTPQEAAARAADDARRSKVASARNAATPTTKGAPGRRHEDPLSGKSLTEALEENYDRIFGQDD